MVILGFFSFEGEWAAPREFSGRSPLALKCSE